MRCGMVPPKFSNAVVQSLEELSFRRVRTIDMETHSLFSFVAYLEKEEWPYL